MLFHTGGVYFPWIRRISIGTVHPHGAVMPISWANAYQSLVPSHGYPATPMGHHHVHKKNWLIRHRFNINTALFEAITDRSFNLYLWPRASPFGRSLWNISSRCRHDHLTKSSNLDFRPLSSVYISPSSLWSLCFSFINI